MNTIKSCYIAGPMRGVELYNFPAFDAAKARLLEKGVAHVVNPADFDRARGFNPARLPVDHDWNTFPDDLGPVEATVKMDLDAVIQAEALALLPGWEKSKGAIAEKAVAEWLGRRVLYPRGSGWVEFLGEEQLEEVAS